jgi:hypothetical protein
MLLITRKTVAALMVLLLGVFMLSNFASAEGAQISERDAREAAKDAYTGEGTQSDVELETKDGRDVYVVEYTESDGTEVDVLIDAMTGDLVRITSDDDDSDMDDDENDDDSDLNDDEDDSDMSDDDDDSGMNDENDDSVNSMEKNVTENNTDLNPESILSLQAQIVALLQQILVLLNK